MSVMSEIKEITYELFKTKGECTLAEIRESALSHQVEIPLESTIIRSTMYQLMEKDSRIKRIARGKYQFLPEMESKKDMITSESLQIISHDKDTSILEDDVLRNLDKIEAELVSLTKELENFKWFQSSDAEITRIRRYGERLKKLCVNINKRVEQLSL